MLRRNILRGAVSALSAAFAVSRANATGEAAPAAKLKVVYHFSDLDKVSFVLGNIQNHFDGVGGPDHDLACRARPGIAGVSFGFREPGHLEASRPILQSRSHTCGLRQHDDIAECRAEGSAAGLRRRRTWRRGPDRRVAIAGLPVPPALRTAGRHDAFRAKIATFHDFVLVIAAVTFRGAPPSLGRQV